MCSRAMFVRATAACRAAARWWRHSARRGPPRWRRPTPASRNAQNAMAVSASNWVTVAVRKRERVGRAAHGGRGRREAVLRDGRPWIWMPLGPVGDVGTGRCPRGRPLAGQRRRGQTRWMICRWCPRRAAPGPRAPGGRGPPAARSCAPGRSACRGSRARRSTAAPRARSISSGRGDALGQASRSLRP